MFVENIWVYSLVSWTVCFRPFTNGVLLLSKFIPNPIAGAGGESSVQKPEHTVFVVVLLQRSILIRSRWSTIAIALIAEKYPVQHTAHLFRSMELDFNGFRVRILWPPTSRRLAITEHSAVFAGLERPNLATSVKT